MPLGFRSKTDSNHSEIVNGLRAVGLSVLSLASLGKGAPDILVGGNGIDLLFELKVPGKKLNQMQIKFHESWRGRVYIVETIGSAIAFCTARGLLGR